MKRILPGAVRRWCAALGQLAGTRFRSRPEWTPSGGPERRDCARRCAKGAPSAERGGRRQAVLAPLPRRGFDRGGRPLAGLLALVLLVAGAQPGAGEGAAGEAATGEEVVAGLSQNRIAITASFDGSEILIFGAVKRETPIPPGPPLQVIVAVAGPSEPVVVRRKERRFGIWVNAAAVEVDSAPSFYAVATSAPFHDVLSEVEDLRYKVSIPRAIRSVGAPMDIEHAEAFTEALIRIRSKAGLYQVMEGAVEVSEQTLFRTRIGLPANLTEGDYSARIFLTRDGKVVDVFETSIPVRKVGLERWIFTLAHERPLAYGLLSLALAILAGWLASAVFRYIRS
ncbi:MAG: hypothetical protein D6811_11415 [Alphaproteobacteria bacterium]|nr:MAG: hypothetical protein D6811_11415 [Alphaproteobacteria bacterium]